MDATDKEVKKVAAEKEEKAERSLRGLTFTRVYSDPSVSPYDSLEWELRTAAITSEKGETIFEQKNVEVPKSWSQTATNIVAQKYFHGRIGSPERESSVRTLIERVAGTITGYGEKGGYFATAADRDAFHDELAAILVNQVAAFNSPVWFNVGIEPKPQASACFINSAATRWARSWTSPRPRGCSSSTARAPARTSRPSAARTRAFPPAALPPARSLS